MDLALPSWVFMWARRLQAKAKRLLHNSQACGLSPVVRSINPVIMCDGGHSGEEEKGDTHVHEKQTGFFDK